MTPPLIKRFLIAFDEYKLINIVIFAFIFGSSIFLAFKSTPQQSGVNHKTLGTLSLRNLPPTSTTTTAIDTWNKDLLLSPQVLEGVKENLNIDNRQIAELLREINIIIPNTENNSPIISIEYTGNLKREESKTILLVFMEEMVEYSRWLNSYQLGERIDSLSNKLELVQQDLTKAEEAYYNYVSTEGTSLLGLQDGSLLNEITRTQTQQRQVKLSLEEINAQIESMVEQLGLTQQEAYRSSILSADGTIANLRSQLLEVEANREQLQTQLRPEHPTMLELTKQKENIEQLLQQRWRELVGQEGESPPSPGEIIKQSNLDLIRQQLANQLVTLETQKEGLSSQLQSLEEIEKQLLQKYADTPARQLEQTRLSQEVERQKTLYQSILTALTEAKAAEAEIVSSLVIAQKPYLKQEKRLLQLTTNPLVILGSGLTLGTLAVSSLTLIMGARDDRLYSSGELREVMSSLNLPVLGQIPEISLGQSRIINNSDSPYLAFYERICSNIRRFGTESQKMIAVTSIHSGEGKSTTAYNLAIAAARSGKRTLLIEADLPSVSLADIFNLEIYPEPRVNPLIYYAASMDHIQSVGTEENLYILPNPNPQKQTANIIESLEFQQMLRNARNSFDWVIIDTPCLDNRNDAILLKPFIGALIMIAQPGITQKSLLNETIEQLTHKGFPLLGGVINCVENLNVYFDSSGKSFFPAKNVTKINEKLR